MFLKVVLIFVVGLGGYFYYQSQLGPEAIAQKDLVMYTNENAAMNTHSHLEDDVVGKLKSGERVLILSEMAGRAFSVCLVETDKKEAGWVRCTYLKKLLSSALITINF